MAATYWNGSTGAWGTAGNWTNGVPSASNTPAVFDGRSQQSVTSGLDQAGVSFTLKTTSKYHGNIGALGNPLEWTGAGVNVFNVLRGRGERHVEPSGPNESFVVDGPDVFFANCALVELIVKRGTCNCASTCDFSQRLFIMGGGAIVTIEEQAVAQKSPIQFQMNAGKLVNKRIWNSTNSRAILSGGRIEQTGLMGNNLFVALHGGVINYRPLAPVAGSSPFIDIIAGLLDFSESDQVITFGAIRVGVDGAIKASALQTEASVIDLDFREDFPDF